MNGTLRLVEDKDWIFILLITICGLILFTRWAFEKYYSDLSSFERFNEKKDNLLLFNGIYMVLFSTILSLLLLPYANKFIDLEKYTDISQITILSSIMLGFIIFKLIINTLIFISINRRDSLRDFIISKSYFKVWATLGLLIFSFFYFFSGINHEYLKIIALGFMGAIMIGDYYFYYKNSSKEYKFSIYYIILYLCTLEILPFMIVSKIILS
ncbi:DUF4271 domain-containing protein [Weeksellaceae bacterium TAE3-ERU29]|nr:DUF4271 domain-containing protein [Weeksellaceae bacterium TAE3-ERU29]